MAQVRYVVDDVDAAVASNAEAPGFTLNQPLGPAAHHDGREPWLAGPAASGSQAIPSSFFDQFGPACIQSPFRWRPRDTRFRE